VTEVDPDALARDDIDLGPLEVVRMYLAGVCAESYVADEWRPGTSDPDFADAVKAARQVNPVDPESVVAQELPNAWHAVDGVRRRIDVIANALLAKVDADPAADRWALDADELHALPGRSSGPAYGPDHPDVQHVVRPPAESGPVTSTVEPAPVRPTPPPELDSLATWRLEKIVLDQSAMLEKVGDALAGTVAKLGDAIAALEAAAARPVTVKVKPALTATLHVPKVKKTVTQTALGFEITSEPEG